VIITPRFTRAKDFSEGLARVKVGNDWGYIDATGNMVIDARFARARDFSDGRAKVKLNTL
jgi:hypothetical protein